MALLYLLRRSLGYLFDQKQNKSVSYWPIYLTCVVIFYFFIFESENIIPMCVYRGSNVGEEREGPMPQPSCPSMGDTCVVILTDKMVNLTEHIIFLIRM